MQKRNLEELNLLDDFLMGSVILAQTQTNTASAWTFMQKKKQMT